MRHSSGFTLVELLVSLVVGGIIISGVYASFQLIQGQYNKLTTITDLNETGRAVMRIIQRDLRMAGFSYYDDTLGYSGQYIQRQPEMAELTATPKNIGLVIHPGHRAFRVVYDYVDEDNVGTVERRVITYSLDQDSIGNSNRLMRHVDTLPTKNTSPELLAEFVDDFYIYQGKSDISNKLVSCYGFNGDLTDEITGSQLQDTVRFTQNGADNSAVLEGPSLNIPNQANLSYVNNFTVSFFIALAQQNAQKVTLINLENGNYTMSLETDGKLTGEMFPNDAEHFSSAVYGTLITGQLKNIVVRRSTDLLEIFVDAKLVAQHVISKTFGNLGSQLIAGAPTASGVYELHLDDMRFYARALDLVEIWALTSNVSSDCSAGNSSLINVSFVLRSRKELDSARTFISPGYIANSAYFKSVKDNYYRKAFATSVTPRNL